MRKLMFTALVSAVMAVPTATFAAGFTTYGKIGSLNAKANTVRLVNGDSFRLPSGVDLAGFSVGQTVKITWNTQSPSSIEVGRNMTIFELKATGISAVD
ncbi:DUF1344 domain-containing protein [Ollibium composti]|jgi:hypothetical protein|uniref:DUF1344 domain-containing protein n=1 Tax=Ollibium composti TaxID=2675109 RepID=A0ABY2Q191_9HYPH|nr:DUF1344 domain-containing protein [Mesorhizobium composti]THF54501.1 DUF1344 domain-containing protein [Mesorhizobium composti]